MKRILLSRFTLTAVMATLFCIGSGHTLQPANTKVSEPCSCPQFYNLSATAAIAFDSFNCGDLALMFTDVPGAEINTGTYLWANKTCTVPFPNGILTSISGSTTGLSFYVSGGVVGSQTTPSPCD